MNCCFLGACILPVVLLDCGTGVFAPNALARLVLVYWLEKVCWNSGLIWGSMALMLTFCEIRNWDLLPLILFAVDIFALFTALDALFSVCDMFSGRKSMEMSASGFVSSWVTV